jgi:hypothetical protein
VDSFRLPLSRLKALQFTGAGSTRVNTNNLPTAWNNLASLSILLLVRPSGTLAGNDQMCAKTASTLTPGWFFNLANASGALLFKQIYATTNLAYQSSTTLATNKWQWVAVTLNTAGGANAKVHIYTSANLWSPLVEVAYSSRTDPSGAVTDDSAQKIVWGNDNGNAHGWPGQIALGVFCPSAPLSLSELRAWQSNPFKTPRGAAISYRFGVDGRGAPRDFSGSANPGTLTGALAVEGPPLSQWQSQWPWVNAAAPGGFLPNWSVIKFIRWVRSRNVIIVLKRRDLLPGAPSVTFVASPRIRQAKAFYPLPKARLLIPSGPPGSLPIRRLVPMPFRQNTTYWRTRLLPRQNVPQPIVSLRLRLQRSFYPIRRGAIPIPGGTVQIQVPIAMPARRIFQRSYYAVFRGAVPGRQVLGPVYVAAAGTVTPGATGGTY